MSSKRLYFVLIGVIGLLSVGLLIGAYGANSLLASRAQKLTGLKAKSLALTKEQASLVTAKADVKKYAGLQKITQQVVPEDKDQAEAVREIVNIAAANGVNLASINFPASTLGSSSSGTASANSSSAAPAPAAGATAAKTNPNTGKLSQLQPVKNIPGVYVLQITVQGDPNKPVPYNSFINFLTALERNRRTAQISTITLQPNATNPNLLSFTLTLNEYIKP